MFHDKSVPVEFEVTQAPLAELLTAAEVRQYLQLPYASEPFFLDSIIKAVGAYIETMVKRPIREQTWVIVVDNSDANAPIPYNTSRAHCEGERIIIDATPIREVSVSYMDMEDEVEKVMPATDYRVIGAGEHIKGKVEIMPAEGKCWPTLDWQNPDLDIVLACGYTKSNIPVDIKHAARLLAAHLYNRWESDITSTTAASVPMSVNTLLAPFVRL